MAHSETTAERHILNHKVVHGSFDRFLCKIKVPGVIFASKSALIDIAMLPILDMLEHIS